MDKETREYIKCGKLICLDDSEEVEESKDKDNLKKFIKESIEEILNKSITPDAK